MFEIEIAAAAVTDLDAMLEIQKVCKLSQWTREAYEAELTRPESIILCAQTGDVKCIGFILGRTIAGPPTEAEIYNIGVLPSYQSGQVGSRLLARFVDACRTAGVERVWLDVRQSNEGALRFYRLFGFLPTGSRKNFYREPVENADIMCLQIAELNN